MPVIAFTGKRPVVPETTWIAPSAWVIGDVVLGEHVSLWFGAVVRGDMHFIRVGDYTNLQDGVIVHVTHEHYPTTIGSYVTAGHRAIIHGCTIEDGCLIGMGATVMDGAVVGRESLVAAGSVITPGTRIPPRSLVMGVPGRVIRSLTAEEVQRIRENTMLYVEYKDHYRQMEQGQG